MKPAYFDQRALIRYIVILVVTMLAMKFSGGTGFVLVVPLFFFAIFNRKPTESFFYLLLTVATVMGNSHFFPKGTIYSLVNRVMLMSTGVMLFFATTGGRASPLAKPFFGLLAYLLVMCLSSAFGWCPGISFLKLLLFTTTYLAYLGVANQVMMSRGDDALKVRSVMLAFAGLFILGSLALVPFPSVGQMSGEEFEEAMKNGADITSLFKGMTSHSQSLGPCIASAATVICADMVFGARRWTKLHLVMLLVSPYLVYLTSSRTAMGSLIGGFGIVGWYAINARGLRQGWKRKIVSAGFTLFFLALLALVASSGVQQGVVRYALKHGDVRGTDVSLEQIMSTRRGLWTEGLRNFRESPLFGNGFQVSEEMKGIKVGLSTMSAPIEKGVWISAVLEEGGLVGFIVFSAFLISVWIALSKHRAYIGLCAFFELLLTNMGEFTMFSLSYTGGFLWAMVFAGLVLDSVRLKERNRRPMAYAPPDLSYPACLTPRR